MRYIIISGIDGTGKTSIINELMKELKNQNIPVKYLWLRFNHYTVKIMNALARVFKLSVIVNLENEEVWQHQFYKSPLFCRLYIICSYIDNSLAKLKLLGIREDVVVCDRWIPDTLVDLGAECRLPEMISGKWYTRFMSLLPKQNILFVIDRDYGEILSSREENRTNPDFSFRYDLYQQLMQKKEVVVIDNSGTVMQSVEKILKQLDKCI